MLCFIGSAQAPQAHQFLKGLDSLIPLCGRRKLAVCVICTNPNDETDERLGGYSEAITYFWDFDRRISELFGVSELNGDLLSRNGDYTPTSILLDPMLRVLWTAPIINPERHVDLLSKIIAQLPRPGQGAFTRAPILILPRIFEAPFCRHLIDYYHTEGGKDSGFMQEQDGKTVGVFDHNHKSRSDCWIKDPKLIRHIQYRLVRRLFPEVAKAFQFKATEIERYLIGCYRAEDKGLFRPHRDNNTSGTAHRRFAVSINLNTGEYEGAALRFPEYGMETYSPPTGGAVVFSCSILHEATPITAGERYVFLPFIFDKAAEKIRRENEKLIVSNKRGAKAHSETL